MRYCLHILKKDLHLLRWQAAGLVIVAAVAVWIHGKPEYAMAAWRGDTAWPVRTAALLDAFLATLWALFAVIVIHQDKLIGQDEFWMTKPIRRRAFMAGKLLFILFAVSLPFFVADVLSLLMQGFEPWRLLPGLVFRQFLFWSVILLPAIALASVTRTLAGAVAGAVVAFAAIAMLGPQQSPSPAGGWASLVLACLISSVTSLAVWAFQVKFRSERGPLIAVGALVLCLFCFKHLSAESFPWLEQSLVPGPEAAAGVSLAVRTDPSWKPPSGRSAPPGMALLHFPLTVAGLKPGEDLVSLLGLVEPSSANRAGQPAGPPSRAYLSRGRGEGEYDLAIAVPTGAMTVLRSRPSSLRVSFTLGLFSPSGQHSIPADGAAHRVPDVGYCTAAPSKDPSVREFSVACRTPLARPPHIMARAFDAVSGDSSARIPLWGTQLFRRLPADFDMSVVEFVHANFAGAGVFAIQTLADRLSSDASKVTVVLETMRPIAVFERELVTPPIPLETLAASGN